MENWIILSREFRVIANRPDIYYLKQTCNNNVHSIYEITTICALLACLNNQNKSGFFEGPAFIQPIIAIWKVKKKPWLAEKKPAFQKSHFCFDHVNRLYIANSTTQNGPSQDEKIIDAIVFPDCGPVVRTSAS